MIQTSCFDGVFTALVTPFTDTGSIDWHAFESLIDRQLAAGITGLVPVGTTGEAATLSKKEALAIITHTVKQAAGRAYVLAGTGGNVTTKSVEATCQAADAGVDGVLLITPYYNRPSQAGLISHFGEIASSTNVDVMLYSVPGRTGVSIEPETASVLAKNHPNIVGIKEAGGDVTRVTALRAACDPKFVVHCGDDGLALPFFALGARGLTSVLSNFAPRECISLYRAWCGGDQQTALSIHEHLAPLALAMFIDSSPSPVKRALAITGHMHDAVRLPLVQISQKADDYLRFELERFRKSDLQ